MKEISEIKKNMTYSFFKMEVTACFAIFCTTNLKLPTKANEGQPVSGQPVLIQTHSNPNPF